MADQRGLINKERNGGSVKDTKRHSLTIALTALLGWSGCPEDIITAYSHLFFLQYQSMLNLKGLKSFVDMGRGWNQASAKLAAFGVRDPPNGPVFV